MTAHPTMAAPISTEAVVSKILTASRILVAIDGEEATTDDSILAISRVKRVALNSTAPPANSNRATIQAKASLPSVHVRVAESADSNLSSGSSKNHVPNLNAKDVAGITMMEKKAIVIGAPAVPSSFHF